MAEDYKELINWYRTHSDADEMRRQVGRAFWNYHHVLAEWTKPEKDAQAALFDNLKMGVKTFPCKRCSEKGALWMQSNPFNPETDNMKTYVWRFHNRVNEKLNKPQHPLPKFMPSTRNCIPKSIIDEITNDIDDETLRMKIKEIPMCEV